MAEEASEVAQIALKTQQFGFNEVYPGQPLTNKERVHLELNDLIAVVAMLNTEFDFGFSPDEEQGLAKKNKVNKYYNLSVTLGEVNDKVV